MITVEDQDGVCRVAVSGELNIYTSGEIKGRLMPLISRTGSLEIDLGQVQEVDSAGVQLLMMIRRFRSSINLSVRFVNHSGPVQEAIELMNLGYYFQDPQALAGQ